MAEDAIRKAKEVAAKLSQGLSLSLGGDSDLGKRNRDDDMNRSSGGLGLIKKQRVYIPVKEYPHINFLGLLIGPRGATQKQLQEASGAKILVRGRGSSKDGNPQDGDDDELHVYIEGSEEAVDKAIIEVNKLLFDPEAALRLKQQQLQNLSQMNYTGIMGGEGASNSLIVLNPGEQRDDGYNLELSVPHTMVGLVIGKGGENIQRYQYQYGVAVQVAKEEESPGDTSRKVTLKGLHQGNVEEVRKKIEETVQIRQAALATGNASNNELQMPFVLKLRVPNDKVGLVIGKSGLTIKAIMERSRAKVIVPVVPDDDDPTVRTLTIGAERKDFVDAAQLEIYQILQQQQQHVQMQQAITQATPIYLQIPDDRVGVIIGKSGSTIKDLQSRTRTRVQIPQGADPGSNPPVRTISISGTDEAQILARYEIELILQGQNPSNSSAAAPTVYGGNPPSTYGGFNPYGATTTPYGNYGAYGAQPAVAASYPYAATGTYPYSAGAAATTATSAEVPSDPTAYYNDFWTYASYYGEAAARLYYTTWSPPAGTSPPPGVTVPPEQNSNTATFSTTTTTATSTSASTNDEKKHEDKSAEAAWEKYRKEYKEWWVQYGKDSGAPEEPPQP